MMYTDFVHRTQICLDDQEVSALEAAVVRTGASRSELIRRAIRAQYGEQPLASRLEALRSSAGTWAGNTRARSVGTQFSYEKSGRRTFPLGRGCPPSVIGWR